MAYTITRGTKRIIKEVIAKHNTIDEFELVYFVCDELWNRYKGDQFDYQLKRMRLETTGQVKLAIDEVLRTTKF